MSKEVVVGIDLGTTNSAVAHIVDGHPVCIPNASGDTLTPSVVSFQPDCTTLVGRAARQEQSKHPGTTYYSVKRLIGRSWADAAVQEEAQRLAYPVSELAPPAATAPHEPTHTCLKPTLLLLTCCRWTRTLTATPCLPAPM